MKFAASDWEKKRKSGMPSFLFFDGILKMGGPFAVVMQVVGFFFLRDEGQGFGEYFSSSRMWITFFFHATLFGLAMGSINWFGNEKVFKANVAMSSIPAGDPIEQDD